MSADQQYFSAEVYYFIVIAKNEMLQLKSRTGGHLIEFHLIESLDRNFLIKQAFDRKCVLSLDRKF